MRHTNSAPEFATLVNNSPLNSNAEVQTLTMVKRLRYFSHFVVWTKSWGASLKMLDDSDLEFRSLEGAERCCGGAGIYNLLEPEMSALVLGEKLRQIEATGAKVLATGNPGCQMQIGAGACLNGMSLRVCHPVELLDESYQKAGFYSEEP
jgi:glycolate oxidase iron-sulfur subunit